MNHVDLYLPDKRTVQFRQLLIGAIGCGNVGYNTLAAFSHHGHSVIGVDTNPQACDRIRKSLGPHSLASSISELANCDIVFICLPTDPCSSGECDLSLIEQAVHEWSRLEQTDAWQCKILVQRSTCPPGTAARLSKDLSNTHYAVNPSFLCKATQLYDSLNPCRIAIGSLSLYAIDLLRVAYSRFPDCPEFISDNPTSVELLKYVENCIDAVLISLWNEFLLIAKHSSLSSADFIHLCEVITMRDRFATCLRVPGKKFGLWCLPKDLQALLAHYEDLELNILRASHVDNQQRNDLTEGAEPSSKLYRFTETGRIVMQSSGQDRIQAFLR